MNLARYVLFLGGQLGMMGLARFFFQWVLLFGEEGGGAAERDTRLFAAASIGLLFFAFRIFDGVTDPVAGLLSDSWVRRGRERRTLLWISFALPSLGLCCVFAPTLDMHVAMRWGLLAVGMFVFFVGYTLYAIPYWSLIDDYSAGDSETRSKLSNVLGAGVLLATALGFVISPILVERIGFLWAAVAFAVPAALLMAMPYFAQPTGIGRVAIGSTDSPGLAAFKTAFSHRRFRAVIVLFAGGQMSFTVMTAAAPYVATTLLGGSVGDVALLLGPFLAAAVPSFLLVPRVAARVGWEKTTLVATVLLGFVYAGVGLLGARVVGSPLTTAMILFGAGGPMAAVLLGLEGEAIAASAREGGGDLTSIYFGVYNFIVKALNGLALYVTGVLADRVSTEGPPAVRMMGFVAGGLLVAGVLLYTVLRPKRVESPGMAGA